jgi:DNA (cytosine-5)-methyltransferase 1
MSLPAYQAELPADPAAPAVPGELVIGSICTGTGALEAAVHRVAGGRLAWVADLDPAVSALLAHRFPGVPNLGDVSLADWRAVEPVDVLCGGTPCQDISAAGRRAGLYPGTRSGVWNHMAYAISVLRPSLVIWENVKGALSASAHSVVEPCPWCLGDNPGVTLRALGAVLGDLSALGYDAEWETVSAADAGACHLRERVVVLAWPAAPAAHA